MSFSIYRNTTVNNMGPSNTTMMLQKATKCPPEQFSCITKQYDNKNVE